MYALKVTSTFLSPVSTCFETFKKIDSIIKHAVINTNIFKLQTNTNCTMGQLT